MRVSLRTAVFIALAVALSCTAIASAQPPVANAGPWNLEVLKKVPQATWGAKSGLVQEVYYEGEPGDFFL